MSIKPITVEVDGDNIVHLALVGDLLEDKTDALVSGLTQAVAIISQLHDVQQKKVDVLTDMSQFDGQYSIKAFTAMVGFVNDTKPYVGKSAVFGGSDKGKMAAEMVIALAHRDNTIKVFPSKEEALAWLK